MLIDHVCVCATLSQEILPKDDDDDDEHPKTSLQTDGVYQDLSEMFLEGEKEDER